MIDSKRKRLALVDLEIDQLEQQLVMLHKERVDITAYLHSEDEARTGPGRNLVAVLSPQVLCSVR